MSRRLVPAYVEKAGWRLYDQLENFDPGTDTEEDWQEVQYAKQDLRAALVRGDALLHAPDWVLKQEVRS